MKTRTPGTNGHARGAKPNGQAPPPLPPSEHGGGPAPQAPGKDPATGRFLPGNTLARGNPTYRAYAANRRVFVETVGPGQVKQLAEDLLRRALGGNMEAAKLCLLYAVGRPTEAVDPDRTEHDLWRLVDDWPTLHEIFRALFDGADPLLGAAWVVEQADGRGVGERIDALGKYGLLAGGLAALQEKRLGKKPAGK
jgi:hypothetical protein